jgi:antitoxin MazE
MKTNLIRIGNSKGIRIPKSIIEQFNLTKEIELIPSSKGLLITSKTMARNGWKESFSKAQIRKKSPENSAWKNVSNRFNKEDWSW